MKNFIKIAVVILALSILISCTSLYEDLLDEYGPSNLETVAKSSTTSTTTKPTTSSSSESLGDDIPPVDDVPEVTFSAPDFTVIDMDGNEVLLSSFAGKPIVINFWATWCGYCKQEMPDFQALSEKYPNVQFVMVNTNDSVSSGKAYIDQNGFTFPVFFDTDGSAAAAYNVSAYPYTFFINASGELVAYGRGMLNYEQIEKGILMITEE